MKNVLNKIGKDIWAYIVCIMAAIVIWSWVFGMITKIKPEEKVSVFIGSYSISFDKYEELNEGRPEYLKTVEVNAYSLNNNMFGQLLQIFGYEYGDILILPEDMIEEKSCAALFAEISVGYQAVFDGVEGKDLNYYTNTDEKVYGIKIFDKNNPTQKVIECLDYGYREPQEGQEGSTQTTELKDYYLLFNKKSVHLSDLSDSTKVSEMNGAIEVAKRLLAL